MAKQTTSSPTHPFKRAWGRDLLITGLISLLMAMALLLYMYGLTDDFLLRLFNAALGIFIIIAGTAFLIIPSVNWVFNRFSKKKAKNAPATAKRTPAPKRNMPKANRLDDQ